MSTWGLSTSKDPKTVGEFELFFESKPLHGRCDVDDEETTVTDLEVKENHGITYMRLCTGHAKMWDDIYQRGKRS